MQTHVTVKQNSRNTFAPSKTDTFTPSKGELIGFGEIKRSPRLQKGPNVLGPSMVSKERYLE